MATKSKLVQATTKQAVPEDIIEELHEELSVELAELYKAIRKKATKMKHSDKLMVPIVPILDIIRNEITYWREHDMSTVQFFREGDIELLLNHFITNYLKDATEDGFITQFTGSTPSVLYIRKKAKRDKTFNVDKFYVKRKYNLEN